MNSGQRGRNAWGDYGRTTYKPPADLRDYVIARDRTSRFPGDNRPARHADLDHIHPWTDGGHTNPDNLQAPSGRAHIAKDEGGWSVQLTTVRTLTWTSPQGKTHTVHTDPYPTDHTTGGRSD